MNEQLLLLPGLMCDARIFAAQVARFPDAQVIAHRSSADTLAAMADHVLAVAPPHFALLGHSMGARVALEVYRRAPGRVIRLALVSTGVHPPSDDEAAKRHALRDLGRDQGMAALVDRWLPPMVATPTAADPVAMATMRTMCIDAGLTMFEAQVAALLGRPEVAALLPTITCPTLVATGALDRWSPPDQHRAIAAVVPHAHLTIVAGAGHMLPVEAPDALNDAIAAWLDTPTRP